jgi:hypothetical protein
MAQQPVTPDTRLDDVMRAQQEAGVGCVENFNDPCCDGAGPPGPKCNEATHSRGKFRIYISPQFRPLFVGCLAYQNTICVGNNSNSAFRLDSPCLSDSATVIGRSAPHTHGSAADTNGTPVGDAGNCPLTSCVKDSDFTVLPSCPGPPCEGPASTREIHTEIVDLNLIGTLLGGLPKVRAGSSASSRPKSFGEVESKFSTGLPADDLPDADSFFDVFVEVDLPICGLFPGGTVYNQQALLIVNTDVDDLPPPVVYIHGNSSFVPVYFKATGPGPWLANDLLGYLTLAGHGVGPYECNDLPQDPLNSAYCAATEMTGPGGCCLPDGTCEMLDLQGCNDAWLPTVDNGEHYAGDGNLCKCGACCLHNGCTLNVTSDACVKLGGRYMGDDSTQCIHTPEGDCIPTLSEWGLLVMGILVLSAATVVIMRRRAMVRGGS